MLDVGCGTGSLALILAPFASHVHGLDVSGEMIRIARAKAGSERDERHRHVGEFDRALAFEAEKLRRDLRVWVYCICSKIRWPP